MPSVVSESLRIIILEMEKVMHLNEAGSVIYRFRIASMDEGRVVLNAREWKGYL